MDTDRSAPETDTRPGRDRAAGPPDLPPGIERPEGRRLRLRDLLAIFRDEFGDLVAHLWNHRRLILGLVTAALVGAVVFAWSGLYSVAATAGHYPFFRTFLAFALRQSVDTHTVGIEPPPTLGRIALIRRGAGHYQGGCAPCHGAPGHARNPITRRMLPEPPYLAPLIGNWTPAELFWIVRHGIKYAGMPSWVAPDREDEVWSVVAFLLRLPGMEPLEYRRLAFGIAAEDTVDAREGLRLLLLNGPAGNGIAACIRCHGVDGAGDGTGAFPRLNIQNEAYLYEALKSYALGTRPSGIMQPVAAQLDDAEMRVLAQHYAAQRAVPPAAAGAGLPVRLGLGERIAREGLPERGVAACVSCHGPTEEPMHPLYPRLAGQDPGYIANQLELWLGGVRGRGSEGPLGRIMAYAVGADPREAPESREHWALTTEQITAVAAWYAAQPATTEPALAGRPAPSR